MAFDFEWANANLFNKAYLPDLWLLCRLRTLIRRKAR